MRTKRTVSSRKRHSLKVKSGGGNFKGLINSADVKEAPLILSCPEFNDLATKLSASCNFIKGNVYFDKYGDGTPKVFMDELTVKLLRGRKVYFLAYFSFNECTGENPATNIMDQYMFMCSLASYGIQELNIVLPYFPTGTMERIVGEGELGTGYYLAHLLNSIPCGAYKNVLYVMDMHALCSRFFFHTNIRTVFITMMPKYLDMIQSSKTNDNKVFKFIVFPDDGAEKRNKELCNVGHVKFITCSKKRTGDDRTIEITGSIDSLKEAIRVINSTIEFYIVDDLVQSGGTMGETAKKLVETLHNEFSPIDAIKTSTLEHIKTKCRALNITFDAMEKDELNINEILSKIQALLDSMQALQEPQAVSSSVQSSLRSENVCKILISLVEITKNKDEMKKLEDTKKKNREALNDIKTVISFYNNIDRHLSQDNRLTTAPKFVINYVVTHSILPKTQNPVNEIIKKVLFFQEYGNMVTFKYITTDSRPHLAEILKAASESNADGSDSTTHPAAAGSQPPDISNIATRTETHGDLLPPVGVVASTAAAAALIASAAAEDATKGPAQKSAHSENSIEVMPIFNVLQSVLTDIDSPYIAPYIIPNAYPEP